MSTKTHKERKGFFLGKVQRESRRVRRPGNTSVRDLMADRRFAGSILDFLSSNGVGKVKEGVCFLLVYLRRGL